MHYPVPSLPALHAFEAAARLGNFTAAAQELHLAPSTVSHRIRELEAQLGFALFERLPRSLRLTDLGKAYVPVVRGVLDELTRATIGLFGSPAGGRVTVRVPVSYGVTFLAPRLHQFTSRHDVRVWIVSAIWSGEAPELEVDLEVEFEATPPSSGAEPLEAEEALLLGPPGESPPHEGPSEDGPGAVPDGWSRVRVLGHEALWDQPELASTGPRFTGPDVTVDAWAAAIELVAHAPGHAALVPARMADQALDDGRVAQLTPAGIAMRETYRLVRPEQSGPPTPESTTFAAWLREQHHTPD